MTRPDLEAPLARMRLQIEAAVLRRLNAGAGLGELRPASVFVRDEASLERLAGGTLRPRGSHRKAAQAVSEALASARERARAEQESSPLTLLGRRYHLSTAAVDVIALALAFEIDLDSRELLHSLCGRRRAELAVETCADVLSEHSAQELTAALAPGAPLRACRALAIEGDGLGALLRLRSQALRWLLGERGVPATLGQVAALFSSEDDLAVALPPATVTGLDAVGAMLARATGRPPLVTLRGPRGAGRRAAALRLARAQGRALMVASIPALLTHEQHRRASLLADVLALATLLDAVVYLADVDHLWDESGEADPDHLALLGHHPGALVVGSSGRGGHIDVGRPTVVVPLTRAALEDRERAWRHALHRHRGAAGAPPLEDLASELAGRYVIGPGAIADVVDEAARFSAATASPLSREGLEAAVGRRLSLRLGTFGSVVARKSRFSELILPEEVVDTLRDLLAMVRERSLILEKWGFQRHLGISRGVSALFSGEPGTGKTMAASVLASELGLELVRIDLSAVVSKFVGETEKNLAKIFDEAQDAHAMLLFDEADSLFGKRTELKSAQDRFANLEVNYILQRMETFDGISVLTTNAENAIDPALQRRLNFRVRFPEPELEEREQLWRQLLPPATGLGEDVDFHALAERFDMTGGYIKNAVVRAAVIAARAGRALIAEDLWSGAHHEYAEMGKVMPQLPMPGRRS